MSAVQVRLTGLGDGPCPECGLGSTRAQRALIDRLSRPPWQGCLAAVVFAGVVTLLAGPAWWPLVGAGVLPPTFALVDVPFWWVFVALSTLSASLLPLAWLTHRPGRRVHLHLAGQGIWRVPVCAAVGAAALWPVLFVGIVERSPLALREVGFVGVLILTVITAIVVCWFLYRRLAAVWFERWEGCAREVGWVQPKPSSTFQLAATFLMLSFLFAGFITTAIGVFM